ncbi:MAG: YcxB family protein [Burkholderiales bacterium]
MRLSFELSWSDAGFTARDSNGQYTTPWSDFIKSKEDGRLFLLYYSDLLFHLVPKQAFPSENSLSEFRSRVQKNVVT